MSINPKIFVVLKEQKNDPEKLQVITYWAKMSSWVADARKKASPAIDVRNVIPGGINGAYIRKDAENAINNQEKSTISKKWTGIDKDYFDAIEAGDIEKARELVLRATVIFAKDAALANISRRGSFSNSFGNSVNVCMYLNEKMNRSNCIKRLTLYLPIRSGTRTGGYNLCRCCSRQVSAVAHSAVFACSAS